MKRLTAVLCVLMLAIASLPIYAIAENDAVSEKFGLEFEELSALGLIQPYKDGSFNPDKPMTRAEMAAIAVRMLGLEDEAAQFSGLTPFNDIHPKHWSAGYINLAYRLGLVKGFSDGSFRPDYTLMPAEAAKLILTVLGYEPVAQGRGGYPSGYLSLAAEKGLLDGVNMNADLKRSDAAVMLHNALEIPVMRRIGFGNKLQYEAKENRTLLTEYLGCGFIKGIVASTGEANLASSLPVAKDELIIDGKLLKNGGKDVSGLLGFYVRAYYKTDNADDILLFIAPDSRRNNTLDIISDHLDKDNPESTALSVVYNDGDGRQRTAKISKTADVIYNGRQLSPYAASDLKPEYGRLELLDNNGDNNYDLVKVWSFETKLVDRINVSKDLIVFKDGGWLDLDRMDCDIRLIKDGADIKAADVKEWDVISLAQSKGASKPLIYAFVSSVSISGHVEEVTDEYAVISGKQYKPVPGVELPALDDEGRFFLDIQKRLAYSDTNGKAGESYGYLVDTKSEGLLGGAAFKIFDASGSMKIMSSQQSLLFNGVAMDSAAVSAQLRGSGGLILYRADAEGRIISLRTPRDYSTQTGYAGYNKSVFSLDFKKSGIRYIGYSQSSFSRYVIGSNCKIFSIPVFEGAEDSDYKLMSIGELIHYNRIYNVEIYDADENLNARVVVIKDDGLGGGQFGWDSQPTVVEKITKVLDNDGNEIYKLYGYTKGVRSECILTNKQLIWDNVMYMYKSSHPDPDGDGKFNPQKEIFPGDIIQYIADDRGRLSDMRVIYRNDPAYTPVNTEAIYTDRGDVLNADSWYAMVYRAYATVTKIYGTRLVILADGQNNYLRNLGVENQTLYYIFDKAQKKLYKAAFSDIVQGDEIVVQNTYTTPRVIMIMR